MLKQLLGLAAALILAAPAAAQDPNKLFPDSRLVVRDRFSDEVVGKGPDLVFIPGLASSRSTWKATAERLRGKYRLHLIQVAGFTGEPARGNASGEVVVPTAEAIDAYLVEQKLTPAVVVGHSLGGTMILHLAQAHPDHLRKAMVVDALPFFAQAMMGPQATVEGIRPMATMIRDNTLRADDAQYRSFVAPQLARITVADEHRKVIMDWGVASDRKVVAAALYEDALLDLRPGLPAIHTPITVLYPDNVPVGLPAGRAEQLMTTVFAPAKTVTLQRIDAAAHFIMFDQPQAFADALDAFLAN